MWHEMWYENVYEIWYEILYDIWYEIVCEICGKMHATTVLETSTFTR